MSLPAILAIAIETIDKSLMRLSPKYKASRFYWDCQQLHIRGDHEFNNQVHALLMELYGYKK